MLENFRKDMQSKITDSAGFVVGIIRSMFNVRANFVSVAASISAFGVGLIFALYQVQEWDMPTSLAIFLLIILFLMLFVALGVICFEIINGIRQFFEERATSASWVSREAPGLLDYEADGDRAVRRFAKELLKLTSDTAELNAVINKYTVEFENLNKSGRAIKGIDKQKKANKVAKYIDRSAIYVEKRAELFDALVKDIARNFDGVIMMSALNTEEDRINAQKFINSIDLNEKATSGTTDSMQRYRESVKDLETQNVSRTIRIACVRLVNGLDSLIKTLRIHIHNSNRMRTNLEKKLHAN